jgi:hypothetical protein
MIPGTGIWGWDQGWTIPKAKRHKHSYLHDSAYINSEVYIETSKSNLKAWRKAKFT